jgi:hypothetical protein
MGGRSSREKGRRGELLAAKALSDIGIVSSRAGYAGYSVEDLQHTLRGVHIEVKYMARPSIPQAYRQAIGDAARSGATPTCLTKQVSQATKAEPWLLTIALADLWALVDACNEARPV